MKLVRVAAIAITLLAAPAALAQQQNSTPAHPGMMYGGYQMPMMGWMNQGAMGPMMGGGMMGPGMMSGSMMMGGGMPMMGMGGHIEGQLAYLKTELKITDAQLPQWNAFADALRASAGTMNGMMQQMWSLMQADKPPSLLQRMELHEQHMATGLEAIKTLHAAMAPLYAALSDEQKRSADQLIHGPMGM